MTTTQFILRRAEDLLTWLVAAGARHPFNRQRYRFNVPEVWYSPWNEDEGFQAIYRKIANNTLISRRKLFDLHALTRQVRHAAGERVLEVGSFRGGSSALLAAALPDARLTLWDNWGKSIEKNDYFVKKVYAVDDDLAQARKQVGEIDTPSARNCEFISEVFPNEHVISGWSEAISLVHFDVYDQQAFKLGISLVWPRLRRGGMFICGGYGSISLDPLTSEINAFVRDRDDCIFVQSQSGLGVIIKK